MAKTNFFLKEPKSENETLIFLFFSYDNKRLKYSTGEKIHPDNWNSGEQRTRNTKDFKESDEFNARLETYESDVRTIYRRLKNDKIIPTNELLRNELDKLHKARPEESGRIDFIKFIEKFIEEAKTVKALNTVKSYQNTLKNLNLYCSHKKRRIDFEDVDLDFYNSFLTYLTKNLIFSQNTVGKHIKNLKVFLNEATDRGLNKKLDYKKSRFRKLTEDTDKIYLSSTELSKIYELDLSMKKKLERARDLFILGCFTGLRFSDFIQLRKENIIDDNKLKIRTQKTNETVIIPIHRYVKEIFEKYDGMLPNNISNQKMNDYLKEVGELAELTAPIELTITKGGEQKKEVLKKYELITTHVARRSFATNLYLADVPSITIMKITGHRTEKSFLRYIRITQEENANKLLNHPFFQS